MEPIVIQFLLGILGGTAAGLVAAQRRGSTRASRRVKARRGRAISRTIRRRTAARRTTLTGLHSKVKEFIEPAARQLFLTPHARITSPDPQAALKPAVSTCPSCGLEAPDALMTEHLLGSPSHRNGVVLEEAKPATTPVATTPEEDQRRSLRNILQILVPPRAFGHRHQQKTENPISRIVQKIGQAQKPLIEPLNRLP